jgi:hypothetical protein
MTIYCFSFEISWGALCDERASFRDRVKERRTKGFCERHYNNNNNNNNNNLLLLSLGNKRYTAMIFPRQFPFVLLVKVKDGD